MWRLPQSARITGAGKSGLHLTLLADRQPLGLAARYLERSPGQVARLTNLLAVQVHQLVSIRSAIYSSAERH